MTGAARFRVFSSVTAGVAAATVAVLLITTRQEAGAEEVLLEPIDAAAQNPFTADVSTVGASVGAAATPSPAQPSGGGIPSPSGSTPGLYGGTQNNSSCNRRQLVAFLLQNGAKARAWVDALNADSRLRWVGGRLTVDAIPSFVDSLTPAVLRADTRVTNHGFVAGRATPVQSVLQAGTAVLIDQYGFPRVRCFCGNPLIAPRIFPPVFRGPRWPGFSQTTIIVVQPTTTIIQDFVFVNVVDGTRFTRPAGTDGPDDAPADDGTATPPSPTGPTPSLGTGDVQVTLSWGGASDLDLHVIDPSGDEISFSEPRSASRGRLDHDDLAGEPGSHVENVFWPPGGAPSGSYEAFVVNLGGVSEPFHLTITVGGQVVHDEDGVLGPGELMTPVPFSF